MVNSNSIVVCAWFVKSISIGVPLTINHKYVIYIISFINYSCSSSDFNVRTAAFNYECDKQFSFTGKLVILIAQTV